MTTYQQMSLKTLPLDDGKIQRQTVGSRQVSVGSSFTSISSSTISGADLSYLKGDLLPDLWKTSSNSSSGSSVSQTFQTPQMVQAPFGGQVWNTSHQVAMSPSAAGPQPVTPMENGQLEAEDPMSSYARSLLPNNLLKMNEFGQLPQLTEENLMYNDGGVAVDTTGYNRHGSAFSDGSEELFKFEQQQQHQQSQQSSSVAQNIVSSAQVQSQPMNVPPTVTAQTSCNNLSTSQPVQHKNQGHNHIRSHNSHNSHTILPQSSREKSHKTSNVNTQLYKTELCASYMKIGVCPYGNKCQFAHGENDLKQVERPPKWRSKPCENWSKFGSCRYGSRCCFKHGN